MASCTNLSRLGPDASGSRCKRTRPRRRPSICTATPSNALVCVWRPRRPRMDTADKRFIHLDPARADARNRSAIAHAARSDLEAVREGSGVFISASILVVRHVKSGVRVNV